MDAINRHWTERSIADFVYRISADFVLQLEKKLDLAGISHRAFAGMAHVSEGRVSQVLNNPGNLTLTSTVQWARALNMKVAIVAYEDGISVKQEWPGKFGDLSRLLEACWLTTQLFCLGVMHVWPHSSTQCAS